MTRFVLGLATALLYVGAAFMLLADVLADLVE